MASKHNMSEYGRARTTVDDREFWSEISLLTGMIVTGFVLVAGMIVNDIGIMRSSILVMLAFATVSTGLLLSTRKHQRVINHIASY